MLILSSQLRIYLQSLKETCKKREQARLEQLHSKIARISQAINLTLQGRVKSFHRKIYLKKKS